MRAKTEKLKKKLVINYDEDGDYFEIMFKQCKDTYFNETKKDYAEIKEKGSNKVAGYAIFNLKKRKNNGIGVSLPIPKEALA